VKTRIVTFASGALAATLAWGIVWLYRIQPRDMADQWPAEAARAHSENTPWYRAATVEKAGSFLLCAPADGRNASGVIRPADVEYPQVVFNDNDRDGFVDSIVLAGGPGLSLCADVMTNGTFAGYSVCRGAMSDTGSVSMVDSDFSGEFDLRIGPGHEMALWMDSKWYDRVVTNRTSYIRRDGQLVEIICSNGQWRIR
jgi:hypothetical protein